MLPSVNTQVGDIHFDFKDSCNCCCWGRSKPKKDAAVFIDKNGSVEQFDASKTADVIEANRITLLRLESNIERLARNKSLSSSELRKRLKDETGYTLHSSRPAPLTYNQLRRIDTVFKKVRKEPDTPPTPLVRGSNNPKPLPKDAWSQHAVKKLDPQTGEYVDEHKATAYLPAMQYEGVPNFQTTRVLVNLGSGPSSGITDLKTGDGMFSDLHESDSDPFFNQSS